MFPPQVPLSKEEFFRRRNELIAQGKPPTYENIDPNFAAMKKRAKTLRRMIATVIIAFIVGMIVVISLLASR